MRPARNEQPFGTRRRSLHGVAGVGAAAAAASVGGLYGMAPPAWAAGETGEQAATMFTLLVTAETLAVAFYCTAILGATFRIEPAALGYLRLAMAADLDHLHVLRSLGGAPRQERFRMPSGMLADAGAFAAAGLDIEGALARAYLAAAPRLAALGQPMLAAIAARHATSEAQHLAHIGQVAGLPARQGTIAAPACDRVAEALAGLAPFLGGEPGGTWSLRFPSPRAYRAALGGTARD